MGFLERDLLANQVLADEVRRLAAHPREEIAEWPEWHQPEVIKLHIPDELIRFQFSVLKKTLDTGQIAVVVRHSRAIFFGLLGRKVKTDGFYSEVDGSVSWFTEDDKFAWD